jgi:hypothetical protein
VSLIAAGQFNHLPWGRKRVAGVKPVTPQFVLRTFERMKMLAQVDAGAAAAALAEMKVSIVDVATLVDWLNDVGTAMYKTTVMRTCAECGGPMDFELAGPKDAVVRKYRPEARYCSSKCRQKAHRKRVTHRASQRGVEP